MGGRSVGKQVGYGLDRVAAVEVGDVRRHLAVKLGESELRRQLDLAAHRQGDGLAVKADLLGFSPPALAQVAKLKLLLRLAGRKRCDLEGAGGGIRPGRLEYFRAAG